MASSEVVDRDVLAKRVDKKKKDKIKETSKTVDNKEAKV